MADSNAYPSKIDSVEQLEELLSRPTPRVIETMARLQGDIVVLGVAGKMGPTLARMAKRASDEAKVKRRIIGVARFSNPAEKTRLEQHGIETVTCNLLDRRQVAALPEAPNVVFMAGMKFGSTGQEALTWAMNTYMPAIVCEKYAASRIVAFSTGNVYGLVPVSSGGSVETDAVNPLGDYACSCLGRERIFEHFSRAAGTPVALIRLNYACEMRYGVLVDLAQRVWANQPVDLAMGHLNTIWQADANAMALQALDHAASPACILNVTGPELISVRQACTELAGLLNRRARFTGQESPDALLSNAQLANRLMGYPSIRVQTMMGWIAQWVMAGGETINKPTHFEARDGKF